LAHRITAVGDPVGQLVADAEPEGAVGFRENLVRLVVNDDLSKGEFKLFHGCASLPERARPNDIPPVVRESRRGACGAGRSERLNAPR